MASPTKKPRNDFEQNINKIIEKDMWSDLSTLLRDGSLSDTEQCGAVEAASKHCAESIFLSLISPHCTSSQLHFALPHLTSRGLWQAVGHVLQRGVSTALLTWSVHQAARQSAQQELLSFILPHCAEDQLDSVLAVLVKRGLWRAVGVLIQQVQGTTRRWAIEKACQEAGEDELVVFILPACSAVETACSLAQVVARGLWRAVGEMLQRGVSDTLCIRTLQGAFTQAECELIRKHILPHCTRDYLNRSMSYLISTGRWNDVDKLLLCVEENMSTWSVDGLRVDSKLLSLIVDRNWSDITALLHKAIEDSYSHAETIITEEYEGKTFAYQILSPTEDGLWEPVEMDNPSFVWRPGGEGFPSCCSHLHSVLVVMCFDLGTREHMCVHFNCAGHQLDSVFTNCVKKCSFKTLSGDFETWKVDHIDVNLNKLIHNSRKESISFLLGFLFARNVWWALYKVSEHGPLKTVPEVSTETAGLNKIQTVDGEQICSDRETEISMSQLVARRRWWDVGAMLTEGVGDSQHEWLVLTACLHAPEEHFVLHVLPHCVDRLLDSVLTVMVGQEAWMAVVEVLRRGVSDSKKQWAVLEACKKYEKDVTERLEESDYWDLREYFSKGILSHCTDDMLDSVLTILAERHLWRSAVELLDLGRGISDCKKRWVVQKAREDVENGLFDEVFNYTDGSFTNIVPHCADDQMDDMLAIFVERKQWHNVGVALNREVSDSVKRLAVEEACAHYDDDDDDDKDDDDDDDDDDGGDPDPDKSGDLLSSTLASCIGNTGSLPDLDAGKRKPVFSDKHTCPTFDEDGFFFEDMFDLSDYNDGYIMNDILPHCANDRLDTVLTTLVRRRLWMAVGEVMKRGVSDSKELWVVKKACHCSCDLEYVLDNILPHCTHRQLNLLLTTLVPRHEWKAVGRVLKQDLAETMRQWVVQEVCKYSTYVDVGEDFGELMAISILPECSDEQVNSLLRTLAERRLWRAVGQALTRNVTDSAKHFAVMELCTNYEGNKCHACGEVTSSDDFILQDILPHCADDHLKSVLPTLAERNLFKSVAYVLKKEVSDTDLIKKVQTVFMRANKSLIETVLPCYVYDDIRSELETLASRKLWKVFLMLLHRFTIDTLHSWAIEKDCSGPKERVFWDMVSNPCDGVKELSPAQWRSVTWSDLQYSLKDCLHWDTLLCELLCEALLGTVREIWLSGREKEVDCRSHTAVEEARSVTEDIHQQLNHTLIDCKYSKVSTLLPCIHRLCQTYAGKTQSMARREFPAGEASQRPGCPAENKSFSTRYRIRNPKGAVEEEHGYGENDVFSSPLLQLHFLKYLAREYFKRKAWTQMTDAVLVVLTTTPVVPGVQSVALRIMVRENRWDVIRHACLSCVCEQDRRQVFQAAVKQRQWGAVKRWADYSLYDDQRLWALGEAKGEKRWDVYLKLAGHGLNEGERMGVLYRVAMHADWKLVNDMVNTVADVSHMKDLLTNTRTTRQPRTKPGNLQQRIEQLTEFEETLKKKTNLLKTLKTAAKQGKWQVVFYNIRHKPDLQNTRRALKAAVSSEAWQTVIQLVRLETDVTRRDSLFRDMVRQQQWAVCRELLDQGVSDDLCVEALNDLMEHRQWTLVAMVMRCPMSEERRTEMMYRALMMREGSVVWQCINSLQHPLSGEQRENIFQLAFKREVWQAVKPLVEKKDETGIRHRDTALLEAIEQHQWDVVDHCQRHHADINMKDDDGHTPIHRAARKEDWEAVKELTVRDGDPNLLDNEGYSVLHKAIEAKQWDVVKLLIQFHGDIHRPSRDSQNHTGLNMLIDARQIDVIQSTFMWCADQWKGVNLRGETTLHAACLSGCPGILHDLIARRVDPLAVTSKAQDLCTRQFPNFAFPGLSALCYAVLCRDCPQRMVAECIKLGFSTNQPHITDVVEINSSQSYYCWTERQKLLTYPLMLAVMRGLPVMTQMLYESGACSNRQVFNLSAYLDSLTLTVPTTRKALESEFSRVFKCVHGYGDHDNSYDTVLMKKSADYMRQISSTPRSLVSTCRLVISRCLTLSKTRHRDIAQLPLSPMLKNYLMFTDLTDPDCLGHQE